jgi:hypothetical protein
VSCEGHAISDAPAATISSPALRTAGLVLPGGSTRSPSRDSSSGITPCIATAPSIQTSVPAARGMRFTFKSIAGPAGVGSGRAAGRCHQSELELRENGWAGFEPPLPA